MLNLKKVFDLDRALWKKIIKCAISYEIATIIVLIPQVIDTVGVPYLVTLGTLFFAAGGATAGNQIVEMLLNLTVMVPVAIWCSLIGYFCTLYNSHIESASLYSNGAGIIAALGFFINVFIVAYFRIKYPRLFIPGLQGFTIPFFALTKGIYSTSFNIMSVVGIFYPILVGGGISLIVNLAIWPETAAKVSEDSFSRALASVQDVLEFICHDLLKESEVDFSNLSASKKLRQYIKTLDGDIARMQTTRKEAKYEIVVSHYSPLWYKSFASILVGISKNLYGFSLAVEREGQVILRQRECEQQRQQHTTDTNSEKEQFLRLRRQQNPLDTLNKELEYMTTATTNKVEGGGSVAKIQYKHISRLQSSVHPEIKRFTEISYTVISCIRHNLQENNAIPKSKADIPVCSHHTHQLDLTEAMESLKEAKIILQKEYEARQSEPTEDHFLIYTILFSLTQFGDKLVDLEQEADQLTKRRKGGRFPRIFFPHVHIRDWLEQAAENAKGEHTAAVQAMFDQNDLIQRQATRRDSDSSDSSMSSSNSSSRTKQADEEMANGPGAAAAKYGPRGAIEKRMSVESNWMDDADQMSVPLQNAPGSHIWNRWSHSFIEFLRTDCVKYATKFAITMELLALMAWLPIPGVNDLFNNNHGQWGLLSAMVVFNFTVGSTALQCFYRVIATIIGAVAGYICLLVANRNEHAYALAIMTFVFQVPMWYIMLGSKYPRIGFVSLLTLAVITSTGYIDNYNEDLFAPVWKRTITAIFATFAVLIVDQVLWPVWARQMVRKHLSDLLIATGIQYSKVASLVCQENTQSYRYQSTLKDAIANAKILRKQHGLTLQMLGLAEMEPRITKAPFPIQVYRDILEHEQHILYWIEHLLVTQTFISTVVRKRIMTPMNMYRREVAASVHLYLFTLACSLRTKSSLPASLPSAGVARMILQERQAVLWHDNFDELKAESALSDFEECQEFRKEQRSAENQIYWQTYAAGTVEVIVEQEAMGELVAKLMGQHVFKAATKDWII